MLGMDIPHLCDVMGCWTGCYTWQIIYRRITMLIFRFHSGNLSASFALSPANNKRKVNKVTGRPIPLITQRVYDKDDNCNFMATG